MIWTTRPSERVFAACDNFSSTHSPSRIARWRSAQVGILCANRMLWEGFDEPRCSAIWLDRDPTSDIALVQMAGRALRYFPGKVARIYTCTIEQRLRLAAALRRLDVP